MIRLQLNGQHRIVGAGSKPALPNDHITLEKLIGLLKINSQNIAVAVNLSVVPRSQFPETIVKDGDAIDIIHPTPGG